MYCGVSNLSVAEIACLAGGEGLDRCGSMHTYEMQRQEGSASPGLQVVQDAERRRAVEKKRKVERSARARVRELERRRERLMSDAKVSATRPCAKGKGNNSKEVFLSTVYAVQHLWK